jgi:hypothetical protein
LDDVCSATNVAWNYEFSQPAEIGAECVSDCPESKSRLQSGLRRVFLLSPAYIAGTRGMLLTREGSDSAMARRLRQDGVALGELFSFMSGLYFRGKLAYARAFAEPPPDLDGAFIITASGGLVPPDALITLERLRQISSSEVDPAEVRYRAPLDRDAQNLAKGAGTRCQIVLLGSIATPKYVDPLLEVFRERLVFPAEFVGRGDMSRGGLMLRCVQSGKPLTYVPVLEATRHGRKPPKLQLLTRGLLS